MGSGGFKDFWKAGMSINTRRLALAIANAVDLVGVDDTAHGKRVGIMARECASVLDFPQAVCDRLFEAGLIHDCGVSSTQVHRTLVTELDWEGAQAHCDLGARLVAGFGPMADLAPIVQFHHTHWDELPDSLDPTLALHANLIYLVDRVDMLAAAYLRGNQQLLHAEEIRSRIAFFSGSFFAPELVDSFLEASFPEAFWMLLTPDNISQYVNEMGDEDGLEIIDLNQLKQFAAIIAHIVDAKSHFTVEHSEGVARLSRYLAERLGLGAERCDKIEIAGLMHDIGKLQIPDEILEKPDILSPSERTLMKSHSFVTLQILKQIDGMDDIAQWASYHHESINGTGYPFHLEGDELSIEARIIRVADIYQAMAQLRPYRLQPTSPGTILNILKAMVREGQIDGRVVDLVAEDLALCHEAAVGQSK